MKKLLLIALLIVGCDSKTQKPRDPLSQIVLSTINQEFGEWRDSLEGRKLKLLYYSVYWHKSNESVKIPISVDSSVDKTTMAEYCNIIKNIHNKYASTYRLESFIKFSGSDNIEMRCE